MDDCAPLVTMTEIVLEPELSEIEPDGCPVTTANPFTVTLAFTLLRVGVIVMLDVERLAE